MKAQHSDELRVYLNRDRRVNFILKLLNHVSADDGKRCCVAGAERYFCFTAIAEISILALFTRAAAWMVARAGLGSGITLL
jgi:hypothetical protein